MIFRIMNKDTGYLLSKEYTNQDTAFEHCAYLNSLGFTAQYIVVFQSSIDKRKRTQVKP